MTSRLPDDEYAIVCTPTNYRMSHRNIAMLLTKSARTNALLEMVEGGDLL
jgi:hypothetical protein